MQYLTGHVLRWVPALAKRGPEIALGTVGGGNCKENNFLFKNIHSSKK
jgi:hypothetical protein